MSVLLHVPFVTALGWALLHFFWQGALIALLLSAVLHARSTGDEPSTPELIDKYVW